MLSLSLPYVSEFVRATGSPKILTEGQKTLETNMVIFCCASLKTHDKIELKALVKRNTDASFGFFTVKGVFFLHSVKSNLSNGDAIVSIIKIDCPCEREIGQICQHAAAVLLHCCKIDLNKLQVKCSIQKQRPNTDSTVVPGRVDTVADIKKVECDDTDSKLKTITCRKDTDPLNIIRNENQYSCGDRKKPSEPFNVPAKRVLDAQDDDTHFDVFKSQFADIDSTADTQVIECKNDDSRLETFTQREDSFNMAPEENLCDDSKTPLNELCGVTTEKCCIAEQHMNSSLSTSQSVIVDSTVTDTEEIKCDNRLETVTHRNDKILLNTVPETNQYLCNDSEKLLEEQSDDSIRRFRNDQQYSHMNMSSYIVLDSAVDTEVVKCDNTGIRLETITHGEIVIPLIVVPRDSQYSFNDSKELLEEQSDVSTKKILNMHKSTLLDASKSQDVQVDLNANTRVIECGNTNNSLESMTNSNRKDTIPLKIVQEDSQLSCDYSKRSLEEASNSPTKRFCNTQKFTQQSPNISESQPVRVDLIEDAGMTKYNNTNKKMETIKYGNENMDSSKATALQSIESTVIKTERIDEIKLSQPTHRKTPLKKFRAIDNKQMRLTVNGSLIKFDNENADINPRNRNSGILKPLKENQTSIKDMFNIRAKSSPLKRQIPALKSHNGVHEYENKKNRDFTELIINNGLKSKIITLLQENTISLNGCCEKTYKNLLCCDDVVKTAIDTKLSQSTWKKERQFRITGSRCYSIYTYSKDDWRTKAEKYFWPVEFQNKYTRHGIKYESVARNLYVKEQGVSVHEFGLLICKAEPWLAYSPDGIVVEKDISLKLLEIKCPYELWDTQQHTLLQKCKFLHVQDSKLTLRKRHAYYGQIQFGMALLNVKSCDFVIYSSISNSIKIIPIEFDEEFARNLFFTLKSKFFNHMLHEICLSR